MHTWKAINVGPGQIYPSAGYLFSSTPTALHDKPIANCEVCGEEKESIKHVLLDCTVAKFFWDQAKVVSGIKIPRLIYTLLRGLGI